MTFSLSKGYPIVPQGQYEATITKVWMEKDCEVTVKEMKKVSDLVFIEYKTDSGKITQRYFPVMDQDTDLGGVVMPGNHDNIPDEIEDADEFFVGRKLGIVVKHNKSRSTGRNFANVADVFCLSKAADDEAIDSDLEDYNVDELELDDILEDPDSDDDGDLELDDDLQDVSTTPISRRKSNWVPPSHTDDFLSDEANDFDE